MNCLMFKQIGKYLSFALEEHGNHYASEQFYCF